MRRLLILALFLPATAHAAGDVPLRPTRSYHQCSDNGFTLVENRRNAKVNKLGDLPAASLVLTVLPNENGCSKPVIVRHGFGAAESHRPPTSNIGTGTARR